MCLGWDAQREAATRWWSVWLCIPRFRTSVSSRAIIYLTDEPMINEFLSESRKSGSLRELDAELVARRLQRGFVFERLSENVTRHRRR